MYEDVIMMIKSSKTVNSRDGVVLLQNGTYDVLDSPSIAPSSGILHDIEDKYTHRFPFTSGTHIY